MGDTFLVFPSSPDDAAQFLRSVASGAREQNASERRRRGQDRLTGGHDTYADGDVNDTGREGDENDDEGFEHSGGGTRRRLEEALRDGDARMGTSPSEALRVLRARRDWEEQQAARAAQLSLGASLSALDATEAEQDEVEDVDGRSRKWDGRGSHRSKAESLGLGRGGVRRPTRGHDDDSDIVGSFVSPGVSFIRAEQTVADEETDARDAFRRHLRAGARGQEQGSEGSASSRVRSSPFTRKNVQSYGYD